MSTQNLQVPEHESKLRQGREFDKSTQKRTKRERGQKADRQTRTHKNQGTTE